MKFSALIALASLVVLLPQASWSAAQLPPCVNDQKVIDKITQIQRNNKTTKSKYDGYRAALNDSDAVLFARLAYAETLAAACPTLNSEILPGIVDVIANRVLVRKGDVNSVVYQRDQFASSLNIYKQSHYRDFLCPKDERLWTTALESATKALKNRGPFVLPKNAFNYYFYLHEPSWPVPDWADIKKYQPVKTPNFDKIQKCIRYFNQMEFN